jgi:hypothetical protein
MSPAERAAKMLEREREKFLGAGAQLTLYDNAGAALVVLSNSFMVAKKTDVLLGEEYHRAEIAEVAGMTQAIASRVKTAKLSTMTSTFTVSQTEEPTTAARTWVLRMSPFKKS